MLKIKALCISGKANSGKDYVATKIIHKLEDNGFNCVRIAYADLLKYILKQFFDWNGEKDEYGRRLLQYVGTDRVREYNENYWVDFVKGILKMFSEEWDYAILTDCRFPNEIDLIKEDYDTVCIKIEREEEWSNVLTDEQNQHSSETSLNNYKFDYTLFNDGTDNIENEINKFLEWWSNASN